jgi:hypothetical protein
MENWKRAVVGGAACASAIFFLTGKRAAGVIFAGVGLATLAAEYPEKFAEIRDRIPDYVDRGTHFLDVVSRVGERIADGERRGANWYEALMRGRV